MNANAYFESLLSRAMPIVVDSDTALEVARNEGFKTVDINDFDFADKSSCALMLITTYDGHAKLRNLWDITKAKVAHLATAKFDSGAESLKYSLHKLLALDHHATLKRRAESYGALLAKPTIQVRSSHHALQCTLSDSVEIANDSDDMMEGWLYSVAEFFEASIVNISEERPSFSLEGELEFNGFIYLANNLNLKERFTGELSELMRQASRGGNIIEFKENVAQRIVLDNTDVTETFRSMFEGLERGLAATEFAVGCASHPSPVDWSINSLLNESSCGVHLGIGMGQNMPHIDFISTSARIV
ncbi:hypothetical protein [Pseudomonas purpurea]|uniref:hypothetical protein n=1 Tax=Pseudomonas purpurea TaxID=3136737 RepID=UPI003263C570